MNTPKTHDNTEAHAFLADYYKVTELCRDHPRIDDIFSGVLAARAPGDTATRALSRTTLFHILQRCPVITAAAIDTATNGRYTSPRSLTGYAAAARVASTAITGFINRLPVGVVRKMTVKQAEELMDAPYLQELAAKGLN